MAIIINCGRNTRGCDVEIFKMPIFILEFYYQVIKFSCAGISVSHQFTKTIDHYSFRMNSTIKNIFPFYKFINQRYKGLNEIRIPEYIVNDKER